MLETTVKPDQEVSGASASADEFVNEMRLAAAIHCYKRGEISQEKAAQVAGLDRTDFLLVLARGPEEAKMPSFWTSPILKENSNVG